MTEYVVVLTTAVVVIGICVAIHYEALRFLSNVIRHYRVPRRGLIVAVLGLLAVHTLEIWFFGGVYLLLDQWASLGTVTGGPATMTFMDYVYYSSSVYTTLGFGDLVPIGAVQLLTGSEALAGLSLITWSASFTFLEMQRLWS